MIGDCLENERFNLQNGNAEQRTTGGLLVWRKSDNWTAFTDGATTWLNGPCGLQSRPNTGPNYDWEGQPGSACNLATAPRTSVQQPPATNQSRIGPSSFVFPTISAPASDQQFACLPSNVSCGREVWWMEWNADQRSDPVQYAFLAPGLVTEYRFIEAIWMLWQWPEGKFLLQQAAEHGVSIKAEPFPVAALAYYRPADRGIRVNDRFDETSTWMVADILAHELKHAADDRAGSRLARTTEDCLAREQVAYQVESRYLKWIGERFGGMPTLNQVRGSQLSDEDKLLYYNLLHIATSRSPDATALEDYRRACSSLPQ